MFVCVGVSGQLLLYPACYLRHQTCDPLYLRDYRSLITVKINLIRNHIPSQSLNYKDKLGELELGATEDRNRWLVLVNRNACWLFSSCVNIFIWKSSLRRGTPLSLRTGELSSTCFLCCADFSSKSLLLGYSRWIKWVTLLHSMFRICFSSQFRLQFTYNSFYGYTYTTHLFLQGCGFRK